MWAPLSNRSSTYFWHTQTHTQATCGLIKDVTNPTHFVQYFSHTQTLLCYARISHALYVCICCIQYAESKGGRIQTDAHASCAMSNVASSSYHIYSINYVGIRVLMFIVHIEKSLESYHPMRKRNAIERERASYHVTLMWLAVCITHTYTSVAVALSSPPQTYETNTKWIVL